MLNLISILASFLLFSSYLYWYESKLFAVGKEVLRHERKILQIWEIEETYDIFLFFISVIRYDMQSCRDKHI